jgi:hypothetical protein
MTVSRHCKEQSDEANPAIADRRSGIFAEPVIGHSRDPLARNDANKKGARSERLFF